MAGQFIPEKGQHREKTRSAPRAVNEQANRRQQAMRFGTWHRLVLHKASDAVIEDEPGAVIEDETE
jgi:hypothetical protein